MKKMILPLGILIAATLASCDRRATIVEPNKQMANDGITTNSMAGSWHAVELASQFEGQPMSLTAVSTSATSGEATLSRGEDGQPNKIEKANYTMLDGNKQIVFNKVSGDMNMLNGSWHVMELTPSTLHMNNENGDVLKFTK